MSLVKQILIIVLLALAAAVSIFISIDSTSAINLNIKNFPKTIHDMKSRNAATSLTLKFFDGNEFITRIYSDNTSEIWMHIAYPQHRYRYHHHPEVCFQYGGQTIIEENPTTISLAGKEINAMQYVTKDFITYFWFANGETTWWENERKPSSRKGYFFDQRWRIVKYMFEIEIKDGNVQKADDQLIEFIKAIPKEFII